jgi:hypothetical protein
MPFYNFVKAPFGLTTEGRNSRVVLAISEVSLTMQEFLNGCRIRYYSLEKC